MTPIQYETHAKRTIIDYDRNEGKFLTAELSLIGEAGEILELFRQKQTTGTMNKQNLKEELGDVLWGCVFACDVMGMTFDYVMNLQAEALNEYQGNVKDLDFKKFSQLVTRADAFKFDLSGKGRWEENLFMMTCVAIESMEKSSLAKKKAHLSLQQRAHIADMRRKEISRYIGEIVEIISVIADKELDSDLDEIAQHNVEKLKGRYDPTQKPIVRESNPELYDIIRSSFGICKIGCNILEIIQKNQGTEILTSEMLSLLVAIKSILEKSGFTQSQIDILFQDNLIEPNIKTGGIDAAVKNLKTILEYACNIADVAKKAHYKNIDLDKQKVGDLVGKSLLCINNTVINLGASRDFSPDLDKWYFAADEEKRYKHLKGKLGKNIGKKLTAGIGNVAPPFDPTTIH